MQEVICGDVLGALRRMPDRCVHTVVTSPPYWGLRDYGVEGQIGLEPTPEAYVAKLVEVFREVRRVLRDDGTLWLNLGDSYSSGNRATYRSGASDNKGHLIQNDLPRPGQPDGLKPKDLVGIPWRVAFALQADGWYLRQDIIWAKPNPMPESVRDRCTKAHEYIFLLSKQPRYYYDHEAIKEPAAYAGQMRGGSTNRYEQNEAGMDCKVYDTRNKRSVWWVKPASFKGAHFATFPPDLIRPCVLAGCPAGGVVLDPFAGAGTTGVVAREEGRGFCLIELNPSYCEIIRERLQLRGACGGGDGRDEADTRVSDVLSYAKREDMVEVHP